MQNITISLSLLFGLTVAQIVPFNQPLPVLTSPVVQVKAGDALHYQLLNARNSTCQATLTFQNDTFLPISAFARPRNCAGDQEAQFRIPTSVPSGAAAFEWKCSGIDGTAVDVMVISGGTGDWDRFLVDSDAACITVHCRTNGTTGHRSPQNSTC